MTEREWDKRLRIKTIGREDEDNPHYSSYYVIRSGDVYHDLGCDYDIQFNRERKIAGCDYMRFETAPSVYLSN